MSFNLSFFEFQVFTKKQQDQGTLEMIQDCKKIGNPAPEFEEIGGSFSITLHFKKSIRAILQD